MPDETDDNADDKDLEELSKLAGVERTMLGDAFANQTTGCVMSKDVTANTAKEVLRRVARHIKPGDWNAVVQERPDWEGVLVPVQSPRIP